MREKGYSVIYDAVPCGADIIPRKDEYVYAVLKRILGGVCKKTVTDYKTYIICHSSEAYPVWVWLGSYDDGTQRECYEAIEAEFALGQDRFNTTHSFASYMLSRASERGISMEITLHMLAYGVDEVTPSCLGGSTLSRCEEGDIDRATDMVCAFHDSTRLDTVGRDSQRERVMDLIRDGRMYFLRDDKGEVASICSYSTTGDIATITGVYTAPEKRRRGYAAMMVGELSHRLMAMGYRPSIYTDKDYIASNACYVSLGYRIKGELCTVR